MSIRERKLAKLNKAILRHHDVRAGSIRALPRLWATVQLLFSMLHYEFLKNDVAIRAQSLSYFTLFSILPLIAGIFLILGFFSQWGPVQKEFEDLMAGLLGSIPGEQRAYLLAYIFQFKDQYLQNLSQKSGTIGVFAVLVLLWIGARVFFNVESLMNRIWSVRAERTWFDRIKNFVVTMVFLPLIYALVISLPKIIERYGNRQAGIFLDQGLLILVIFATLLAILKGFPNTRVSWRSAVFGAISGTLGYAIANTVLRIYFRFGTDTAYGKAGVLPVFAFFIYVGWLIFIFAVEVSLLVERGAQMIERRLPGTSLGSALVLERVLRVLNEKFLDKSGPQDLKSLAQALHLGVGTIETAIEYLERKSSVVRIRAEGSRGEDRYTISKAFSENDLDDLLNEYLQVERIGRYFDVGGLIRRLRSGQRRS
ncbi:MAG: YihY/virulence factor BrkB family protein [Bdellovibrionales bacterium]|nr:YihY/virulence factor BrkB family protein [Bdellovibrionales bacterium]